MAQDQQLQIRAVGSNAQVVSASRSASSLSAHERTVPRRTALFLTGEGKSKKSDCEGHRGIALPKQHLGRSPLWVATAHPLGVRHACTTLGVGRSWQPFDSSSFLLRSSISTKRSACITSGGANVERIHHAMATAETTSHTRLARHRVTVMSAHTKNLRPKVQECSVSRSVCPTAESDAASSCITTTAS
jgi:hypothetical protein